MNVIFLGPPGVGKGTIAKMITDKYKMIPISTGDLFRAEIKANSDIGKKANEYISKGQLVPDEITIDILKKRINQPDCNKGFILDGFPRTIPQADHLSKSTIKIQKAVNFTAGRELIIQRLSGRRTCSKCGAIFHVINIPPKKEGICDRCGGALIQRDDDKPEAIKKRLVVYEEQTAPLIDYYKKKNMLVDVDASQELNKIFEDTVKAIGR